MATGKSERRRLHPDKRRLELLALARKLFNERTYDAISIDDLASAAGISKGLLYHYFPSKRVLYVHAVRAAAAEMMKLTAPPPDLPVEETLDRALDAYLDYVEANAKGYQSLLGSGVGADAEVARIVEATRRKLVKRILVDGLGVRRPGAALRIAARGWIGFVESAVLEWLKLRDLDRPELRSILARALWSAMPAMSREPKRLGENESP
jgi:AcrR family transcriptional regulator